MEMTWQTMDTAPRDGTRILAKGLDAFNRLDDHVYITSWTNDVYAVQGGRGGPSGWFSGNYGDHWGDDPIMDKPVLWMELPK